MSDAPNVPAAATDVAEVAKAVFACFVRADAAALFELFGPAMRAAIPLEKASALLAQVVAARGGWQASERAEGEASLTEGTWLVRAERGEWKLALRIDGDGRVANLALGDPVPVGVRGLRTLEEMVTALESMLGPLPGRLRAALLAVDRRKFVRECDRELAYENIAMPLDTADGVPAPPLRALIDEHGSYATLLKASGVEMSRSMISQPLIYAATFKALGLAEGHRYLDVGSGTGYGAALASHIVGPSGQVTTMDVDPYLVEQTARLTRDCANVSVLHADGLAAADLLRTHDRCWLTFAVERVPEALLASLAEGAVLLAPVGPLGGTQMLTHHSRQDGKIVERQIAHVRYVSVRGLIDKK
jgi:protein-L-isoaspartate(D-aspartate) O-methyltransferase